MACGQRLEGNGRYIDSAKGRHKDRACTNRVIASRVNIVIVNTKLQFVKTHDVSERRSKEKKPVQECLLQAARLDSHRSAHFTQRSFARARSAFLHLILSFQPCIYRRSPAQGIAHMPNSVQDRTKQRSRWCDSSLEEACQTQMKAYSACLAPKMDRSSHFAILINFENDYNESV